MKNQTFRLVTIILLLCILGVLFKRSIEPGQRFIFNIDDSEAIMLLDMNETSVPMAELFGGDTHYVLMLDLSNCDTCIYNGLNDLKSLRANGSTCSIIIVHDWIQETRSWSVHADGLPVYMLKRPDYYAYVRATQLPVLATIKNGKIEAFRVITLG